MASEQQQQQQPPHRELYESLTRFASFPNEHQRKWWAHTGPMLVKMLHDSGYSRPHQLSYLYLLQQAVVPTLGVFPDPGHDDERWWSALTPYGIPFELSWNVSQQIVRVTFDPIDETSGTPADVFSRRTAAQAIEHLARLDPQSIQLDRFRHFQRELCITDAEEQRLLHSGDYPAKARGQQQLSLDLGRDGAVNAKAYFYPGRKATATEIPARDLSFAAIEKLQVPELAAPLHTLRCYLSSSTDHDDGMPKAPAGINHMLLACDVSAPAKSRIKYYVIDQEVSWARTADLWTIGGRRLAGDSSELCQEGLDWLKQLWDLLQIPQGFRSDVWPKLVFGQPPTDANLLTTFANYTLSPKSRFPEPQIYLITFGMNDLALAKALSEFYRRLGWEDLARTYVEKVQSYYPGSNLSRTNFIHEGVSFSYRDSKPYLSVYYAPFGEIKSAHDEDGVA
ncbi:aromatic prenyl-transferase [Aspergillus homomorphus CBS 101889]|uniref:Aromatic prenyl-transferase n=1 Tax=Aspergillus homomorphus (strain CBS 101889) TaxID=1450537 RepID=A0A395HLV1_ASPHC|nr:aromatic prenyl-transferase [Aspergillus homomorphus CBS 101889]RAL08586.1 aromatic prenyl-transferase [Aspergillus homomorphus CBS 101889]